MTGQCLSTTAIGSDGIRHCLAAINLAARDNHMGTLLGEKFSY